MATVAPPVGHSFAQQELDTFTIRKISFIVVLLRNCGTTGTGLIYYLKNRFYCGIYCGFTISVNCFTVFAQDLVAAVATDWGWGGIVNVIQRHRGEGGDPNFFFNFYCRKLYKKYE